MRTDGHMEQRRVEQTLIEQYIEQNQPSGLATLSEKSSVAVSYIKMIRMGVVPPKVLYRRALAGAIGVSEDDLFPVVRPVSNGRRPTEAS